MTGQVRSGIGDALRDVWDSITGIPGSVVDGLSLVSDPLGWTFNKVQEAADGLVTRFLPWLMEATKPDLTAEWFLTQYAFSFAIAIMVWALIMLGRLLAVARGAASGGDLLELLTTRSMTFIAGAMWGPAVGWMLVGIFHALSEGILGQVSETTAGALAKLQEIIQDPLWWAIPGGLLFAIGLMVCILLSLSIVIVMMVIAMVALYLSGVIFPLAWVWITDDPARRTIAYKAAWVWLGLNAAHPLMYLLLGTSFALIAGILTATDEFGISLIVHSIMTIIVMIMTALSPVLLFKFAPILPTNAGQSGPSLNGAGGGGSAPSNNMHKAADKAAEDQSQDAAADDGGGSSEGGAGASEDSDSGSGGGASGSASGSPASPSPGPLERAAMEGQQAEETVGAGGQGESAGEDSATGATDTGLGASTADGDQPTSPAEGAEDLPNEDGANPSSPIGASDTSSISPSDVSSIGPSDTSQVAQAPGVGAPEAGAGGTEASAAAGSQAGAAEVAAGAGAAETATGVGAVVGIPTLVAAAGMKATEKAVDASKQGAQMAAADMDEQGEAQ